MNDRGARPTQSCAFFPFPVLLDPSSSRPDPLVQAPPPSWSPSGLFIVFLVSFHVLVFTNFSFLSPPNPRAALSWSKVPCPRWADSSSPGLFRGLALGPSLFGPQLVRAGNAMFSSPVAVFSRFGDTRKFQKSDFRSYWSSACRVHTSCVRNNNGHVLGNLRFLELALTAPSAAHSRPNSVFFFK